MRAHGPVRARTRSYAYARVRVVFHGQAVVLIRAEWIVAGREASVALSRRCEYQCGAHMSVGFFTGKKNNSPVKKSLGGSGLPGGKMINS